MPARVLPVSAWMLGPEHASHAAHSSRTGSLDYVGVCMSSSCRASSCLQASQSTCHMSLLCLCSRSTQVMKINYQEEACIDRKPSAKNFLLMNSRASHVIDTLEEAAQCWGAEVRCTRHPGGSCKLGVAETGQLLDIGVVTSGSLAHPTSREVAIRVPSQARGCASL